MGAFAQLERALIRDRQRERIEAAKAWGVYRGRSRRLTPEQVLAAVRDQRWRTESIDGLEGVVGAFFETVDDDVAARLRTEAAAR